MAKFSTYNDSGSKFGEGQETTTEKRDFRGEIIEEDHKCWYIRHHLEVQGVSKCKKSGEDSCITKGTLQKVVTCGQEKVKCHAPTVWGCPKGECEYSGWEIHDEDRITFNYNYEWIECYDEQVNDSECNSIKFPFAHDSNKESSIWGKVTGCAFSSPADVSRYIDEYKPNLIQLINRVKAVANEDAARLAIAKLELFLKLEKLIAQGGSTHQIYVFNVILAQAKIKYLPGLPGQRRPAPGLGNIKNKELFPKGCRCLNDNEMEEIAVPCCKAITQLPPGGKTLITNLWKPASNFKITVNKKFKCGWSDFFIGRGMGSSYYNKSIDTITLILGKTDSGCKKVQ